MNHSYLQKIKKKKENLSFLHYVDYFFSFTFSSERRRVTKVDIDSSSIKLSYHFFFKKKRKTNYTRCPHEINYCAVSNPANQEICHFVSKCSTPQSGSRLWFHIEAEKMTKIQWNINTYTTLRWEMNWINNFYQIHDRI